MRPLLFAAVVLIGCDGDTVDPSEATASDLYGIWSSDVTPGANASGISFRASGVFHPELVGKHDVYAMYDRSDTNQFLDEVGTYRVAGGVLYRLPVWRNGATGAFSEYARDLFAIARGGALSMEGDDPSIPMATYNALADCSLQAQNGWRTYSVQRATYVGRNQVGGNPVSVQFFDGALMGTFQNLVFSYDGDCIPEVDGNSLGGTALVPTSNGMHALVGYGVGDTSLVKYAKLTTSKLPIPAPQETPVMARDLMDWADVGGALMMLVSATPPTIVGVDGTTIALPADAPQAFSPTALIDLGGRPALVGLGFTPGASLWLLEYTGSGWTQTQVPSATNPAYVNAASHGDDVYIVHTMSGDNGGKPRVLFLTRRIGGAWQEPLAIGAGAKPEIFVDDDGVVHVTSSYELSQIDSGGHYARIEGDTVSTWVVPPGPIGHDPFASIAPPVASLDAGVLAIGWASNVALKRPGERDERKVPLTITIEGTGRVTSNDGVVDCSQTCTVDIEVGRALLLHADPIPIDSPNSYDENTRAYVFRTTTSSSVEPVSFRF